MAIIIKHLVKQKRYIVIGPAYGFSKTSRNNVPYDTSKMTFEEKYIVGCDDHGELHWLEAHEVRVESVDGRSCQEVLGNVHKQ